AADAIPRGDAVRTSMAALRRGRRRGYRRVPAHVPRRGVAQRGCALSRRAFASDRADETSVTGDRSAGEDSFLIKSLLISSLLYDVPAFSPHGGVQETTFLIRSLLISSLL